MTIRTRFAPSPTGYLHVGGVRTALFSWLYARKHGGEFILRIEDTDLERSSRESVNAILEGMSWLGLEYDKGPFFQTERFDRYGEVIRDLLDQGRAYRCYCSREELEQRRAEQMANKQKPRYDGRCRDRTDVVEGVDPVIRFRNPDSGEVVIDDLIKGRIVIDNRELDDLIIARSDGTPTYNLTVVVDDLDMGVNYVLRGDDHVNNTPRQINILTAMGAELPRYAHVPMILGADGGRLSKRHGAVSVMQYRDDGYLPEAVLNYLVRLGWSSGDREVFSTDEMIRLFELSAVNKAPSTFNPEKLLWLNHHYIKTLSPERVAHHLGWHLGQLGIDPAEGPAMEDVIVAQRERCRTLVEMAQASAFLYRDFETYDPKAARKNLTPDAVAVLDCLHQKLSDTGAWEAEAIHQQVEAAVAQLGVKFGKVAQPLRVAVCGTTASPSIDVTLALLGPGRTLSRIQAAIDFIQDPSRTADGQG